MAASVPTDAVCTFEAFGLGAMTLGRDGKPGYDLTIAAKHAFVFATAKYEPMFSHFFCAKSMHALTLCSNVLAKSPWTPRKRFLVTHLLLL